MQPDVFHLARELIHPLGNPHGVVGPLNRFPVTFWYPCIGAKIQRDVPMCDPSFPFPSERMFTPTHENARGFRLVVSKLHSLPVNKGITKDFFQTFTLSFP